MTIKSNNHYYKILIFLISIFIGITTISNQTKLINNKDNLNNNEKISYENLNNSQTTDITIPDFELNLELQNITIKENEKYTINDFILLKDLNTLENINYYYQDEKMNTYSTPGQYTIIIIFKDSYEREIIKETTLTIEKKVQQVITKKTDNKKVSIEKQILNDNKKIGTHGRIYFSSLYSIALYQPTTSEEAQKMVDNKDSGAYYRYGNIMIVADHAYQGFSIIKSQKVGNYVYIKKKDQDGKIILEKYIIKEKTTGINTGPNLITDDKRDIGKDVNYDLALYTCNSKDGYRITIVLLDKVA